MATGGGFPALDELGLDRELAPVIAGRLVRSLRSAAAFAIVFSLVRGGVELWLGLPARLVLQHRTGLLIALAALALSSWTIGTRQPRLSRLLLVSAGMATVSVTVVLAYIAREASESAVWSFFAIAVMGNSIFLPMAARVVWPMYAAHGAGLVLVLALGPPRSAQELYWCLGVSSIALGLGAMGASQAYDSLRSYVATEFGLRAARAKEVTELERTRIARELHDLVGARLGGLALQAERTGRALAIGATEATGSGATLASASAADTTLASTQVLQISTSLRQCLVELREAVWALTLPDRDASEVLASLRRGAEDLAAATGLAFTWRAPAALAVDRLAPSLAVAMSAIIRESLMNAARHGSATRVTVALEQVGDALELEVADNGNGMDPGAQPGQGMSNMRVRTEVLGGALLVASAKGEGVRVRVRLPLTQRGPEE